MYRGRCIDRLLQFWRPLMRFNAWSETACFGSNTVTVGKDTIANYSWKEEFGKYDVPKFRMREVPGYFDKKEHFRDLHFQQQKLQEDLFDSDLMSWNNPEIIDTITDATVQCLAPEANREAVLWTDIKNSKHSYFIAKSSMFTSYHKENCLFLDCISGIYVWHAENKHWLQVAK